MSRINANSACPKRKIMATNKVTDPSNEAVPALASHKAAADAAEAKRLADVAKAKWLTDATTSRPTLVAGNNNVAALTQSHNASILNLNKRNAKDAEFSGPDASPESGEMATRGSEGMSVSLFTESYNLSSSFKSACWGSGEQSEPGCTNAPPKKKAKKRWYNGNVMLAMF